MTPTPPRSSIRPAADCVVIGGGIIGLSIAYELSLTGRQVQIVDRQSATHTASWAAGGLLPPPIARAAFDPLEQFRTLSHQLFPAWCQDLQQRSGIELELERCGGLYLGRRPGERVSLRVALEQWHHDGVEVERWDVRELARQEPQLAPQEDDVEVYHLPHEFQVRTPRLLKALRQVLEQRGVPITRVTHSQWHLEPPQSPELRTDVGNFRAHDFVIAAGPWAPELLRPLELNLPIEPRRGQIVLFRTHEPLLKRVVNEGPRYLIARRDGHLLVGSTVEDVGYDGSTTPTAIEDLVGFARGLLPELKHQEPVRQWAALRPWSPDGVPYLGATPRFPHIWFSGAHFRSGIHLAPATGRLMKQLICQEPTDIPMAPYSLSR